MSKYLLLPVTLIYLIIAENKINFPLIGSNKFIYLIILLIAFYIIFKAKHYKLFIFCFLFFPLKLISIYIQYNFITVLINGLTSILFISCGAIIYGNNYKLLNRQLILFISLCVPIMILQIIGVDPLFMIWDTSFLDDPLSEFSLDNLGQYKNFELYPTIFTSDDDLQYQIGQARPAGLTYNNNVLSIFIVLAIAINLIPRISSKLKFSDYIVSLCAVLSMSKMVFISLTVIYIFGFFYLRTYYRNLIFKLVLIFLLFLLVYFFIFPGVFIRNLSVEMIMPSILTRLNSFLYAINAGDIYDYFYSIQLDYYPTLKLNNEVSNTFYSELASSNSVIILLPFFVYIIFMYRRGMASLGATNSKIYLLLLIACLLTQFGVSFYIASSFQLILGCALFPLYYYFKVNNFLVSYK
jgi:hypothetical protein